MPREAIYIPFPRALYDDLVRFSDGGIDPAALAVDKVETWIDMNFTLQSSGSGWFDDNFPEWFGDRLHDFAEKYAPSVLDHWAAQDDAEVARYREERVPLIWKEVTVPAGSEVRMLYGGTAHHAKIRNGKIVDEDGEFSPSSWAYKVANNTSRNAWRDLWFKLPGNPTWVPAQLLRQQAIDARRMTGAQNPESEESSHG